MSLKRLQIKYIISDLEKKMVIITGPRQVGKTWIAKEIAKSFKRPLYLNYDDNTHRGVIDSADWGSEVDLLILDEIHKKNDWKRFVKGVYDTKSSSMRILLTGSARLSVMQKIGESVVGRYFVHHILPLSVAELKRVHSPKKMNDLLERGGFPEPLLGTSDDAERWHQLYLDGMIHADVLNFATVEDLQALSYVVAQLRSSVGSPISYTSIARNIGKSPETVKRYIQILSDLYIIFIIRPFSHKINRAILKEPKIYFYDTVLVENEEARLENMVAFELLKDVYFQKDIKGDKRTVHYVRTKDQKEVDFLIAKNNNPLQLIEVKRSNIQVSDNLRFFFEKYKIPSVQVVKNTTLTKVERNGIVVQNMEDFLGSLLVS